MSDIQTELADVSAIELVREPSVAEVEEILVGKIPVNLTPFAIRDYQVACIQERAGAAFRQASNGESIPNKFDSDFSGIISGILKRYQKSDWRLPEISIPTFDVEPLIASSMAVVLETCAPSGAIAGAPRPQSSNDPNYWFFWQRDGGHIAIALSQIATKSSEQDREKYLAILSRYVSFCSKISENIPNEKLGISRFEMDGTPIDSYGSPQQDGPAITALALLTISELVPSAVEVSKPFLLYLCSNIAKEPGFDAWEFSAGQIFYGKNLARRALRKARLMDIFEEFADHLHAREHELEDEIEAFYEKDLGYITSGQNLLIDEMYSASRLDVNVIGSFLTAFDPSDDFMNVDDNRVVDTMRILEAAFSEKWPVNVSWRDAGAKGFGLGRFPEDMNDGIYSSGGNPWSIATLWGAQYHLALIKRFNYLSEPDRDATARQPLRDKANGYLSFVLAGNDVSQSKVELHEQIDGFTGQPRGAAPLGWAHAELASTLLTSD